jgi:molybdate transport system substrate-binding protein
MRFWLLAVLAWCAGPAFAQTLVVAVDSSLAAAMPAVVRSFEASRPDLRVTLQPGAASALLEQVARGAQIDVLAGLDAETAARGVQRKLLLPELRSTFAGNTLVLVVPASLNLPVRRLADLARPEVVRIAMGRQASVAAGRYAREAINAQRLWPSVQGKMVFTDDEPAALALVAAADVEAGFVYGTSAAAAGARLRLVETLPTSTPIRYQAHAVAASPQAALAAAFVAHLRSEAAQAEFRRLGFGLP